MKLQRAAGARQVQEQLNQLNVQLRCLSQEKSWAPPVQFSTAPVQPVERDINKFTKGWPFHKPRREG